MRHSMTLVHSLLVSFAAIALVSPSSVQGSASQNPKVTVADVIHETVVDESGYQDIAAGSVGQFSPNGKKVVLVLRRGNLEHNTNEYSLLLWNVDTLFTSGAAEVLFKLSSSSNRPAIRSIQWSSDNETLTFLGENPKEKSQLYALNTRTRRLRVLTNHSTGVDSYSLNAIDSKVVFTAPAPFESLWDAKTRRDGVAVSQQSIPDLILGRKADALIGDRGELYVQDTQRSRRMNVRGYWGYFNAPSLSPDGRYVVISEYVPRSEVPEVWLHYQDPSLEFNTIRNTEAIPPEISLSFRRYELVDTVTGNSRVLLDSPIGFHPNVVWLPDSHSVVLSDVFLPYDNAIGKEREERQRHAFIVEVGIPDGKLTKIGGDELQALRWDVKTNRLVCKEITPEGKFLDGGYQNESRTISESLLFLAKSKYGWQRLNDVPQKESGLPQIVIRQGMNEPPKLWAIQPARHQQQLLLDLNPQFRTLRFGKVQEIRWQWAPGQFTSAGLYYPPDYVRGKRYPLVIQTHGWTRQLFMMDGVESTGYAAQPLASGGIMVLQVDDELIPMRYGATGQREEANRALDIYQSAIDYLDGKSLIDRNHVGIFGFSHTCFYVKYALVHSKVRFAAASVAEGEDGGYLQFITNHNLYVDVNSLYGGPPFGKNLKSWIELSPGFNIDKVHTPLRITTLRPQMVLYDWEWFEALTLLGRPVDMVMLQDGDHVLKKPWERMVVQQGNVDWFRFWLQGYEDPDPAKAPQYRRWEKLRGLRALL